MDFEQLIETYGYAAIFFGACLEGETVLLLGGIAAGSGLLAWPGVLLAGVLGTWSACQAWFAGGRLGGDALLRRRPHYEPKVARAQAMLKRHGNLVIIGYRVIYGLRTVAPMAMGMAKVHPARFAILDGLAWTAWFTVISGIGVWAGESAMPWLDFIAQQQRVLLGVVIAAIVGWWLWSRSRGSTEGGD